MKNLLLTFLILTTSLIFSYSETDVKKLKFTGVCENCDFSGLIFSDYFEEKKIWDTYIKRYIDRTGIDLKEKILNGSNFKGANLSNVNFQSSNLEGTNFEEANLSGAYLNRANLSKANFKNANLSGAGLNNITTKNTNFMFANLSNSRITERNPKDKERCCQVSATFRNANLTSVDWGWDSYEAFIPTLASLLEGLDFRGANLTGTSLVGAYLTGADFTGAIFRNVDISGAQIRNANFTAVDLSQTEMQKVSFKEVFLCGTIMPWGKDDSGCSIKIEKPKTDMDDFDL